MDPHPRWMHVHHEHTITANCHGWQIIRQALKVYAAMALQNEDEQAKHIGLMAAGMAKSIKVRGDLQHGVMERVN